MLGFLTAVAAIAGLGYFVVSFAPDYIARYLVRTYFEGLAIDTSGVETIDIDPLRGEIRFGPVSFRGGEGEAGQVGQIKVHVDVRRLLSRQALVQSAEIDGIRIDVRQATDGAISINGIPLKQILAKKAAQAEAPPAPSADARVIEDEAEARAWGAGLDLLRLRDSRIVFTSARGGEATLQVNELVLEGFATWAPDESGRFRLDGELNRMHIAMSGTATPFADNVAVDATLAVSGIEIGKIETYTGLLGFSPSTGRIDVTAETKGSKLLSDGGVDARLVGRASLAGFDLARPEFGSLQLKAGVLNLDDIRLLYDATGGVDVAGNASLDLDAMALRLKDGTEVGFAGATVGLPALAARLPASGPPSVAIAPQLEVRALRLGGRYVEGTADTVAIRLSDFDIDTQTTATPFTATGTVDIGGLALVLPLKKPIKIGAGTIRSRSRGDALCLRARRHGDRRSDRARHRRYEHRRHQARRQTQRPSVAGRDRRRKAGGPVVDAGARRCEGGHQGESREPVAGARPLPARCARGPRRESEHRGLDAGFEVHRYRRGRRHDPRGIRPQHPRLAEIFGERRRARGAGRRSNSRRSRSIRGASRIGKMARIRTSRFRGGSMPNR